METLGLITFGALLAALAWEVRALRARCTELERDREALFLRLEALESPVDPPAA